MEQVRQTATLLVDGEVLKQHIFKMAEVHNAQTILQYLYRMVSQIQTQFPETTLTVNYYGVRAADEAVLPISQKKYQDVDVKQKLRFATLPNAELQTFWSRMYYPYEQAWVMKPESYNKTKLEDDDFLLNEQPKGLLTQLVDAMAEKAVCHRDNRLFVYGDADDMTYALETTNALGMSVSQVLLDEKNPYLVEVTKEVDPTFCDRGILEEVSEFLRQPWAKDESLSKCMALLRGFVSNEREENILMLDVGSVRQYLARKGIRMSVQNVENLVQQIQKSLPEMPTQTIFYHGKLAMDRVHGNILLPEECPVELLLDKKNFNIPGIKLSLGTTQQDKIFPAILKKDKWFVHPTARRKEDFIPNFRQYDVDDRIAYDMALARLNPRVKRVYLVSTDGDFAYSVEQATRAELPVSLVCLNEGNECLSARLERSVQDKIQVAVDLNQLATRKEEKEAVHQHNEEAKRERLRTEQRRKKEIARLEAVDAEDEYVGFIPRKPSKKERWAKKCISHKRMARQIIAKTRGTYDE